MSSTVGSNAAPPFPAAQAPLPRAAEVAGASPQGEPENLTKSNEASLL